LGVPAYNFRGSSDPRRTPAPVDIIFNPIVDTDYRGGFGGLEFVPATRVAYNFNDKWAAAFEEYSDDGPLRHFLPLHDQFHEVWAVMDHSNKFLNIETGIGFGVTVGADRLTLKLMLSRDLNPKSEQPTSPKPEN
jgi:hypothetical protein